MELGDASALLTSAFLVASVNSVTSESWFLLWNVIFRWVFGLKEYVHSSMLTSLILLIPFNVSHSNSGISTFPEWAVAFPDEETP